MEVVVRRCAGVVVLLLVSAFDVGAQSAFIAGKVTRDNGDPMGGVAVAVEELKREVRAAEDGAYRVDNVPPGNYHVSVRAEGYSTRRTEVTVPPQGVMLDLVVELDLHFAEVLSVSPEARAQFESYQPTSVLAGQDLPLKKARVGILGFTFKENVPDIRNSKVIDIYSKLRSYGVEPLVHDPLADSQAMLDEYGIAVSGLDGFRELSALILAVPHSAYAELGPEQLGQMMADGGIFVDVKSKYRPEALRPDLRYWSL